MNVLRRSPSFDENVSEIVICKPQQWRQRPLPRGRIHRKKAPKYSNTTIPRILYMFRKRKRYYCLFYISRKLPIFRKMKSFDWLFLLTSLYSPFWILASNHIAALNPCWSTVKTEYKKVVSVSSILTSTLQIFDGFRNSKIGERSDYSGHRYSSITVAHAKIADKYYAILFRVRQ
jgi:hypothetical protein